MKNKCKSCTQCIAFRRTFVPVKTQRGKNREIGTRSRWIWIFVPNPKSQFLSVKSGTHAQFIRKARSTSYARNVSIINFTSKFNHRNCRKLNYFCSKMIIIIIVMICVRSSDQHCSTNKPGLNCLPTESATSPTTLWSLFRYVLFFFFYARFPSLYFTRSLSHTLCLSVFTFYDWLAKRTSLLIARRFCV